MTTKGDKFQQLAKLVSALSVEQTDGLRHAMRPVGAAEPIDAATLRSSPQAAATALLAALTRNRIRQALDPADASLDAAIDRILDAPIRDGQAITQEMWNLVITRLRALEQTCALLTHALIEAFHPSKPLVADPFHTTWNPRFSKRS